MSAVDLIDRAHSLAMHGGVVYAARQSGLYRVDNKGAALSLFHSWRSDQEIPALALAIDAGGDLMLAGIQGGVARSTDCGATWETIQLRAPAPLVTCLAAAPDFASSGCALAGTYEDGVFRSTDAGKTWLAVSHGLFDHSVYALALSPRCDGYGFVCAGTGSGIYISENGGRLWRDLAMPAGHETVLSLALAESGALYAGTEAHGLLRSRNGGETWETLLETAGAVNAIALADAERIIAQVDDRLLRSSDGGEGWLELAGAVECFTLDGESVILAMSDGSIAREIW